VVTFFLILLSNRMPSKTNPYNYGNIFSHANILLTYLAAMMFNPAVSLDGSVITEEHVVMALLGGQGFFLLFLLFVSFGNLKQTLAQAKVQVKRERKVGRNLPSWPSITLGRL
jgi:hypothetical protein